MEIESLRKLIPEYLSSFAVGVDKETVEIAHKRIEDFLCFIEKKNEEDKVDNSNE